MEGSQLNMLECLEATCHAIESRDQVVLYSHPPTPGYTIPLVPISQRFSMSNDGVALLSRTLDPLVPSLVTMINQPKEEGVSCHACENAAATLSHLASTDAGIVSCLTHRLV